MIDSRLFSTDAGNDRYDRAVISLRATLMTTADSLGPRPLIS
jgi:hypothetical protein